jgi:hypothetical protein
MKLFDSMPPNSVIQQAIKLGFDFGDYVLTDAVSDIAFDLEVFFFCHKKSELLPIMEFECEVENIGKGMQRVDFEGYSVEGEIVDFSQHSSKDPEHKIYHSAFLEIQNGLVTSIRLFCLVGETEHNVPNGYFFDAKSKTHKKLSEEKIYRLMNHDSLGNGEEAKFEAYTIVDYNQAFGTSYTSVEEALVDDPEYIFTEEDVEAWESED